MKRAKLLKNIGAIGAIVIIAISLFVLAGYIILQAFLPEPTIIQTASSPDGKYVAYVFESSRGATTGFIYHISIMQSDKKLGKGNGNVYINSSAPPDSIEWLNNNELYVNDYRSINTTKQKINIYDIKVKYRSLEE